MTERKHFVDNLRTLTILMLFPYHVFMMYNTWGESFYIHGQDLSAPSAFITVCSVWMMPLLFALAGMSSYYALKKRSSGEYAKERVNKLLIPLIFGMLLIVPIQSYFAGLYFNGSWNLMDCFTTVTDLSGYDGAFAIGHLWFLLFLFCISMVCLPLMARHKSKGRGHIGDKAPLILVVAMGLLPCVAGNEIFGVFDFSGKSILESLVYFLLGYFVLSGDGLLRKLDRYRFLLVGLLVVYIAFLALVLGGELYQFASWLAILALLGMGAHYLDRSGKAAGYLSRSSFGIYVLHLLWIVVLAYFVFKITDSAALQILLVLFPSVGLTYLTYELFRRTPGLRWAFGLK